jgi:hypothetical protein
MRVCFWQKHWNGTFFHGAKSIQKYILHDRKRSGDHQAKQRRKRESLRPRIRKENILTRKSSTCHQAKSIKEEKA